MPRLPRRQGSGSSRRVAAALEENDLMKRANRTIGEALEDEDLDNYLTAVGVLAKIMEWHNGGTFAQCAGLPAPGELRSR